MTATPHPDRHDCGGLWVGGICVECEAKCPCCHPPRSVSPHNIYADELLEEGLITEELHGIVRGKKPAPRSFHPDDAFRTIGADEMLEQGLITKELHELATNESANAEKTTVSFMPFEPANKDKK